MPALELQDLGWFLSVAGWLSRPVKCEVEGGVALTRVHNDGPTAETKGCPDRGRVALSALHVTGACKHCSQLPCHTDKLQLFHSYWPTYLLPLPPCRSQPQGPIQTREAVTAEDQCLRGAPVSFDFRHRAVMVPHTVGAPVQALCDLSPPLALRRGAAPVAEVENVPTDGPMDINTAVRAVLKKALQHDGLARGLHEGARAIEKGQVRS